MKKNPGTRTMLKEVAEIQREHQSFQRMLIAMLVIGSMVIVGLIAVLVVTTLTSDIKDVLPPTPRVAASVTPPVSTPPPATPAPVAMVPTSAAPPLAVVDPAPRPIRVVFTLARGMRVKVDGTPLRPKRRKAVVELAPGDHHIETRLRGARKWVVQEITLGGGPGPIRLRYNNRKRQWVIRFRGGKVPAG